MKLYKTLSFVLLFVSSTCFSQTFSGRIIDKNTNAAIPFAAVYLLDFEIGTLSDSTGYFQFDVALPKEVKIRVSKASYETIFLSTEIKTNLSFYLSESHIEFDEIVISSSKNEQLKNSVLPIEVRKLKELKIIPTSNLGEALANIPGVYQSSTGNGISKPVIRGLQGNRVVTYLNGLRIENQQWGGDHGMGINDLGLNQIEVIKGPASLQFGGDALGGVIYFSDDAYAKQNTQQISAQSQFESNTLGFNNRVEYKISGKSIRFNLAALHADHADYRLPSGLFAGNSRFNEKNIKAALSFNHKRWITHFRYNFVSNQVGIPGHSEDSLVDFNSFKYTFQERKITVPFQEIRNHFASIESKYFFTRGEVNLILGQTSNQLTELEESTEFPAIKMTLNNSLYHFKFKYNINENLSLLSGVQGMFQVTKNEKEASEFLIPKGKTNDNGAYLLAFLSYKKWNFQSGIRYDTRQLKSLEDFNGFPRISKSYDNLNFSLGAVRNTKKTTLRFNLSNAYRSPHFSELLSNGEHHGTLRYEIGDPNLKTEKGTQADVAFEFHNEHLSFTVNPFYSLFQNYIYINPSDSMIDNLTIYHYKQMDQADLYGIDLGVHYHPHFAHFMHIESSFSSISIQGETKNAIAFIPQNRINTFLKFSIKMKQKFKLEQIVLQHSIYFKQTQIAFYETPSKMYNLINAALNFKWDLKTPIYFDLGFKNITNESYINHLSRLKNIQLESPGFNFYFSVKYSLESK